MINLEYAFQFLSAWSSLSKSSMFTYMAKISWRYWTSLLRLSRITLLSLISPVLFISAKQYKSLCVQCWGDDVFLSLVFRGVSPLSLPFWENFISLIYFLNLFISLISSTFSLMILMLSCLWISSSFERFFFNMPTDFSRYFLWLTYSE